MVHKPKIYLLDVTNRDGVQTSRICLSKLQKTMINWYWIKWVFSSRSLVFRSLVMKQIT
jgi:hypothetical protein